MAQDMSNDLDDFQFYPKPAISVSYRGITETTNNEMNAQAVYRSVPTSAACTIGGLCVESNKQESIYTSNLYERFNLDTSQGHFIPLSAQTYVNPTSQTSQDGMLGLQQPYQWSAGNNQNFEKPSPMLTNDYSQWSHRREQSTFTQFSDSGKATRQSIPQGIFEPRANPYQMPVQPLEYQSLALSYTNFTQPTTYTQSTQAHQHTEISSAQNSISSWTTNQPIHTNQTINGFRFQFPNDPGLPIYHTNDHNSYSPPWNMDSLALPIQAPTSCLPTTSLPDVTPRFYTPQASMSSSMLSEPREPSVESDATSLCDSLEDFPSVKTEYNTQSSLSTSRRALPSTLPSHQESCMAAPKQHRKRSTSRKKSDMNQSTIYNPKPQSYKSITTHLPTQPQLPHPLTRPLKPSPLKSPLKTRTSPAPELQDPRNEFLIKSKLAGMSYRDIRHAGGFTEAESTLRGRFRNLTKHKSARVRKPRWTDDDVQLLKRAVRKLADKNDLSKAKIPWKKVADYIAENGGSYHFGSSTCRKRWDEVRSQA